MYVLGIDRPLDERVAEAPAVLVPLAGHGRVRLDEVRGAVLQLAVECLGDKVARVDGEQLAADRELDGVRRGAGERLSQLGVDYIHDVGGTAEKGVALDKRSIRVCYGEMRAGTHGVDEGREGNTG